MVKTQDQSHGVTTRSMTRKSNKHISPNHTKNKNNTSGTIKSNGDNEAMCYAYNYITEKQALGLYCNYKSKDWEWDLINKKNWKGILNHGNHDKKEKENNNKTPDNYDDNDSSCDEQLDCNKNPSSGYRSHGFQIVRVLCDKGLFISCDERYNFIEDLQFQMRHNIEGKGSFGWRVNFGGQLKYGHSFGIEYHSDSKIRIYNVLAMLFAYRDHVNIDYKIELWEQSYNFVGYADK